MIKSDIKTTYKNELAFFYGDKSELITNIKTRIEKYTSAPPTPEVKERLELLKGLLEWAER